jgi:hypothetical protein
MSVPERIVGHDMLPKSPQTAWGWSIFQFGGFILDPHGEERGNAARLEP